MPPHPRRPAALLAALLVLLGTAAAARAPGPNVTTVYVLPHSHDDVGWVRTLDEYYDMFVSEIYDTAVASLVADPSRRFQAVEQAYFSRWYAGASNETRAQTRRLVSEGRLEFAVGAWAMTDEAVVDLPDMLEAATLGHDFILREFGVRPRFGFQVDPFGASTTFARVSARLGFNAHVISRVNDWDKRHRQRDRELQFVWRPSASQPDLQVFTHMMDEQSYCTPPIPHDFELEHFCEGGLNATDCPGAGFYWDGDDSRPSSYWQKQYERQGYQVYPYANATNVKYYAEFAAADMRRRAQFFRTPHLLWPFGCDFQHFNATAMFGSMDRVIEYLNVHEPDLHVRYATLSEYFADVHAANQTWPTRGDEDFMSYTAFWCPPGQEAPCNGTNALGKSWTGFYASHAWFKDRVRRASALLRGTDALVAAAAAATRGAWAPDGDAAAGLRSLREAVGVMTHHDAVTGTAGPGVNDNTALPGQQSTVVTNYDGMLRAGANATAALRAAAANAAVAASGRGGDAGATGAHPLGPGLADGEAGVTAALINACPVPVTLFNPTGWALGGAAGGAGAAAPASVRVAVPCADVEVVGPGNATVPYQLLARWNATARSASDGRRGGEAGTPWVLEFEAGLPALGHASFLLRPKNAGVCGAGAGAASSSATSPGSPDPVPVPDGNLSTPADGMAYALRFELGELVGMRPSGAGAETAVRARVLAYRSFGNNTAGVVSGSYIFRPDDSGAAPLDDAHARPTLSVVRGPLVTEVWQEVSPTCQVVYRVRRSDPRVEVELHTGPLPGNREAVLSLDTGLRTGGAFYTDSNGAQTMPRRFNGTTTPNLPTSGYVVGDAYRPITRYAFVRDEASGEQLTVVAARGHGACSVRDGQLELMLHRRELQDDNLGACFAPDMPDTDRPDGCPAQMIPMNLTTTVRTRLWLVLGQAGDEAADLAWRRGAELVNNPPLLFSASTVTDCSPRAASEWLAAFGAPSSALAAPLPPSVHLLTLGLRGEAGKRTALVRLQHLFDKGAASKGLAATASVRLDQTFREPALWGVAAGADGPDRLSLSGVWTERQLRDPDVLWRWRPAAPPAPRSPLGEGLTVTLPAQRIATLELDLFRAAAGPGPGHDTGLFDSAGSIASFGVACASAAALVALLVCARARGKREAAEPRRAPAVGYGTLGAH